jgi:hypothetical protein
VVLSNRERYVAAAALIVIGIFLLDRFALTPLQDRRARTAAEQERVLTEMKRAHTLFERRKQLLPVWQAMLAAGLDSRPDEAESRVLHGVRNWSREAGFALTSLRPERVTQRGQLQERTFQAAGTGNMSAVAGFLWRLESSSLPVRVAELQLGTRAEGTDDLTLQLRISALCRPPAPAPDSGTAAASARSEETNHE